MEENETRDGKMKRNLQAETTQLYTARGLALKRQLEADPEARPWAAYPRPRMVREGWINLNGLWDFGADDGKDSESPVYSQQIRVPFPPESALSGVRDFDHRKTPYLYYRRAFILNAVPSGKRLLLHCGGGDQNILTVRFNGAVVSGGCCTLLEGPLVRELPDPRAGENLLELALTDFGGTSLPWGKQLEQRGGMWYTPVSGIWQTVWLEWVPEAFITELRCTPTLEEVRVEVLRFSTREESGLGSREDRGGALSGLPAQEGWVLFAGRQWPIVDGKVVLRPETPRLWTPEDPHLYEFTVICGEDRVDSYFALRTVGVGTADGIPRLLLNGKPYFFNGLLDQGYWPEGLWTPPEPACFADDIRGAKKLGFNMLRKHIKIEPELFYYECDRLGMAVFQDMMNLGPYSFLRDTALPTVRIQRVPHLFRLRSRSREKRFLQHMESVVRRLYSHPSVVYWTVFNEGWGQQYTTGAYKALKALDSTRIIDTASGWFRIGKSDVDSRHVYFRPFRMPKNTGKPLVLSEFGGYVYKVTGHSFNPAETYGYKTFRDREAWQEALKALYAEQIWANVEKGLCAAVYTQLSDVEDETNGLVTYDRVGK